MLKETGRRRFLFSHNNALVDFKECLYDMDTIEWAKIDMAWSP